MTDAQNYRILAAKLRSSANAVEVARAEQSAERIYNAGLLTARQYGRICDIAFSKLAILEVAR